MDQTFKLTNTTREYRYDFPGNYDSCVLGDSCPRYAAIAAGVSEGTYNDFPECTLHKDLAGDQVSAFVDTLGALGADILRYSWRYEQHEGYFTAIVTVQFPEKE